MRSLQAPNRVRNGLMAIVIVLLVVGVGQSFGSIPMLFAQPNYYAQFTDAAGIRAGDKIRMAGIEVGLVRGLQIQGNKVLVEFTAGGTRIGADSRAAIRTETILGRRSIDIENRGRQPLRVGAVLPLAQTSTPYQIYDAFTDITKAATGWDVEAIKRSLNMVSQTIDQTSPHLSAAFDGIKRFAETIGKRDQQFRQMLANAKTIATTLSDRSEQINALLVNAGSLLAAINERGSAVTYLLERTHALETQIKGLIDDNPNLNHVLNQLRVVTDVLMQRKGDLAEILTTVSRFAASIGEGLGSGPYFKAMVANLLPYQILQPWVDAAFKKRGIDPEQFWRSAGLPAFRFPDPNGTRLPNGAPPAAPPPLEGTPDHPGPAVPPGTPCSYVPPLDGLPRPDNSLPCALRNQNQGPFGSVSGPAPAPPDVVSAPPNPAGLPRAPGIPIAGLPGHAPPEVPGNPVPLPPGAPPGARTDNLGPAGPVAPPSTLAPPLPPRPPALPGPGPQLPPATTAPLPGNPPYLPPGSQGGDNR
jgi:phospholipid/cholesterol/gamma-HCH transport system substrate-binding protein